MSEKLEDPFSLSREFDVIFEEYKAKSREVITREAFREVIDNLTNPANLGFELLNTIRTRYGLSKVETNAASGPKAVEYYKKKIRQFLDQDGNLDLKAIRKNLRMSQDEFSRTFGVPINTICSWEQDVYKPRGANMLALAMIALEPELAKRAAIIFRETLNDIRNKK